jgi:hypothetical protein
MFQTPPRESHYQRHAACVNALDNFFELDAAPILPHNENTSHTSSAAGPAKPMFACELCCPQRNLLTSLFSTAI